MIVRNSKAGWIIDGIVIVGATVVIASGYAKSKADDPVKLSKNDWSVLIHDAGFIGSATAKVTVVEFVDYQCPVCARLETIVAALHDTYPGTLRRVIRHFPIEALHEQAEDAAVAFECARAQGKTKEMHAVLLQNADAVEKKQWAQLAVEAGVKDLKSFDSCLSSEEPRRRVRDDHALGSKMGVVGTPTFVIDWEWYAGGTPPQLREKILARLR